MMAVRKSVRVRDHARGSCVLTARPIRRAASRQGSRRPPCSWITPGSAIVFVFWPYEVLMAPQCAEMRRFRNSTRRSPGRCNGFERRRRSALDLASPRRGEERRAALKGNAHVHHDDHVPVFPGAAPLTPRPGIFRVPPKARDSCTICASIALAGSLVLWQPPAILVRVATGRVDRSGASPFPVIDPAFSGTRSSGLTPLEWRSRRSAAATRTS